MPYVGQRFGRYRIEEEIGAGGMGVVYRAYDEKLERDLALKVLTPGALNDDAVRVRPDSLEPLTPKYEGIGKAYMSLAADMTARGKS